MSQLLIQQYLNHLQDLRKVSGTDRESVVREAFKDLLKNWALSHDLVFIPEYEIVTPAKDRRYVDGALLYTLRVPFGYWEAKDTHDNLDQEIEKKLRRGYPQDNIIFEDSERAVLIQNRQEVMRCAVDDVAGLGKLLKLFFEHERPEIAEFRKGVEQFKSDLPQVLLALRDMISGAYQSNPDFRNAAEHFLKHAQETINPSVTDADVREMLIQHILTEEIFSKVFGDDDFHRQNNIAKQLYALEGRFFTGNLKRQTLKALEPYYAAIRTAADQISTHSEKQTFLKVIYENFYKVYNKKAADRLGVVYTPNEIVRFMVESSDWLCEKYFATNLIDPNVEILDPATGTGSFITELLEHFRGQPAKLTNKYREGLHANEVAILPYYVANLNIEATYAAITNNYLEFPNLCFVDTLDNVAGLRKYSGHQDELFGSVSEENVARIKRQNRRKISVVIGNPPYNANQLNENENNKNREYPTIDKRVKDTYIAAGTARKTKLYDMYARFFRWASDRIAENGIIAFVSNRSFIEKATFDGFRKTVAEEFNYIYILDLGGDVRANPKLSGTKHNVFGIQTGVAISFLVKRAKTQSTRIYYLRRPEFDTREDKLAFLNGSKLQSLEFDEIHPDAAFNFINLADTDFASLIPVASRETKLTNRPLREKAIFKLFSLGVSTNRDLWIYDFDKDALLRKMHFFARRYREQLADVDFDTTIKWSRNLKRRFRQGRKPSNATARSVQYRPFCKRQLYDSDLFIDEVGSKDEMFPIDEENIAICFSDAGSRTDYCVLAVNVLADLHLGSAVDAYQQVPLYRYEEGHRKTENITEWAFAQFRKEYQGKERKHRTITKRAIFNYVYAVLHDPIYRQKYSLNLRRALPRIPFYSDFWQWAEWGQRLIDLHIGYETVEPWPLTRTDVPANSEPVLRADIHESRIVLDSQTALAGIPHEAWEYRLGSRSALEWILDQYKERNPKDVTIREKFNNYRFSHYKDKVIDLLTRVTRVSVDTQRIVESMRKLDRSAWSEVEPSSDNA
jgi:predicted helicase